MGCPTAFLSPGLPRENVCGITHALAWLSPTRGQVVHVLRTRSPVVLADPRDLHVLSTPPAFVLSQDQTLQWIVRISSRSSLSLLMSNAVPSDTNKNSVVRITDIRELISPRYPREQRINESHNTTSHTRFSISDNQNTSFPPVRGRRSIASELAISREAALRDSATITVKKPSRAT